MAKWAVTKADKDKGLTGEDGAIVALIADPAVVPEFIVIKGLMGQGVAQDTWRIYQNYEFTEYYEAASADIKRVEPAGRTVRVWLERKAYRHVAPEDFSPEGQYLKGEIAAKGSAAAEPYAGPNEFGPEPTHCPKCAYATY